MIFFVVGIILLLVYIGSGIFVVRMVRNRTRFMNTVPRLIILSFVIALVFGVGIFSNGGHVGFGFPAPIIIAGLFGILAWIPVFAFTDGIIFPFLFWWVLFFVIMLFRGL